MTTPTITLTGIQPTGELHLGNYAGAIRPVAELAAGPARETYVFIADVHALNGRPDPAQLRDRTRKMAAALLACGLDHDRVHLYRQSRVPAIAQITAPSSSPARSRAPIAPASSGNRRRSSRRATACCPAWTAAR